MTGIRILATGSSGNCSEVGGDILIDLGVRKGEIPDDLVKHASACLITHCHIDHIVPATLKWLDSVRPDIVSRQLFMNAQTCERMLATGGDGMASVIAKIPDRNIIDASSAFDVRTRGGIYHVECFKCPHGYYDPVERTIPLENQGFVIDAPDGQRIIWATDTMALDYAPDCDYDVICVEGNYDERLLEAALRDPVLFSRAKENRRHLSIQEFERFALSHSRDDSVIIQLHMSSEFGIPSRMNTTDMSRFYG